MCEAGSRYHTMKVESSNILKKTGKPKTDYSIVGFPEYEVCLNGFRTTEENWFSCE